MHQVLTQAGSILGMWSVVIRTAMGSKSKFQDNRKPGSHQPWGLTRLFGVDIFMFLQLGKSERL
jgi:hypothetical protein